jgi:membrane dipeptidase
MKRRQFIAQTSLFGAAIWSQPFTFSNTDDSKELDRVVAKTFGIDTHNHVDVPFLASEFLGQNYDLAGELKRSGLGTICLTFSVDRPLLKNPGEAYDRFSTIMQEIDQLLHINQITRALTLADIHSAQKNNRQVVIQSVEGAHFLEGNIERLAWAYQRGLRHLGLLHDNDASPSLGDVYTNPPVFQGLSAFGIEVIRECNRLGILIDMTHGSDQAIDHALENSTKPILISHTGLNTQLGNNPAMAQMMKPRLIRKEQAQKVANAGGVIGVWKHLTDSPKSYVENIRHMVDAVGIDHVCLGTDSKLATATGTNSKPPRMGDVSNGIWENQSKGFYFETIESMIKSGFSESEMMKIGSGNYLRLFEKATSK